MEEADRERDKHETRRLLYVALTRARDRLYLSSALKEGALSPGRGSLAEVLPESVKQLFAHAAQAFPEMSTVAWTGPSGRPFEWRLVRPAPGSDLDRCAEGPGVAPAGSDLDRCADGPGVAPVGSDLDRCADGPGVAQVGPDLDRSAEGPGVAALGSDLDSCSGQRNPTGHRRRHVASVPTVVSVSAWLSAGREEMQDPLTTGGDVLTGSLVHRMLQAGIGASSRLEDLARALLTAEERATLADTEAVIRRAVADASALLMKPEVVALFSSGTVIREVPFSITLDSVLREDQDLTLVGQNLTLARNDRDLTPPAQSLAPTCNDRDLTPPAQRLAPARNDRDLTPARNVWPRARNNQDLTPGAATVLRGRIDLLVVRDDGGVIVVEFKTGRRRPEHERQLAIYVQAARALYPGRPVDGCLVYP
jgi:hypothetical protein